VHAGLVRCVMVACHGAASFRFPVMDDGRGATLTFFNDVWPVRFELTRSGFTARRSDRLSYGHREHGRDRTCVGGSCSPAPVRSATCSRHFRFAIADLRFASSDQNPDRQPQIANRKSKIANRKSKVNSTPCRDRTCRFPGWSRASRLRYRLMQLPLCHLRGLMNRTVSVEGFEPSTPCTRNTCSAKLRYTLICETTARAGSRTPILRLKAGRPGH
jgi:hypothetical protein